MKFPALAILTCCLCLYGCAPGAPVPIPTAEQMENAYYGPFPENYRAEVSRASAFSNFLFPVFEFSNPPRQMMVQWLGKYQFGWGGYVDVWLEDYRRSNFEKAVYQYLFRDDKLIMMKRIR